jgi:DNA-binding response OmpR family regulator
MWRWGMDSPNVLVVDDSPFVARALVHVLETRGLAARAAEALSICAECHPSLLVTDVCMPNIDLIDLCHQFRAAADGQRVFVLLFSAHSEKEIGNVLWATGADVFMEKRHGVAAVVARIEALFAAMASGQSHLPPAPAPG